MTQPFLIGESIRFGWKKLREHSGLMFAVVLTVLGLQLIQELANNMMSGVLYGLLSFALTIAGVIVGTGSTYIGLRLVQGHKAAYADIMPPPLLVLRVLGAQVLLVLMTLAVVGVALLLIFSVLYAFGIPINQFGLPAVSPGVQVVGGLLVACIGIAAAIGALYIALRYAFVQFAVLDGAGVIESLHKSTDMTAGVKLRLLLFWLAMLGINLLGLLAFVVGLIVSIPISMLAYAHVYDKLKHHRIH